MNSISDADQRILGPQHVATTLAGMEAPQDSTEPLKFSVEALQIPAEAPFGAYHVYCMGAQYSKSLR